jgi:hypothetical protein
MQRPRSLASERGLKPSAITKLATDKTRSLASERGLKRDLHEMGHFEIIELARSLASAD